MCCSIATLCDIFKKKIIGNNEVTIQNHIPAENHGKQLLLVSKKCSIILYIILESLMYNDT